MPFIGGVYFLPTGTNPPFPGQLISTNTLTIIIDDIASALNNIPPIAGSSIKVGTTQVQNGTNGYVLYNNNGVLDNELVPNAALVNSTISGVSLGNNLANLSYGTHLTNSAGASSYNGSAASTLATDATSANTASTIVARDGSGNFSAGTITASLTGHASLDLALTGGTLTGALTINGAALSLSGSISEAAWTTSGVRYANPAVSYTDTSSSGTVGLAYSDLFGATTINASGLVTYTEYISSYFKSPVSGTNVTITNGWALGTDNLVIKGFLQIDQNATLAPAVSPNGVLLNLIDGNSGGYVVIGYSGTPTNQYIKYDGTAASPTGLLSGDLIGREGFGGYDGTAQQNNKGQLDFFTAENWVHNTAYGTYFSVFTVPKGTTSPTENMRLQASGGLSVGSGQVTTDPGEGGVVVDGQIYGPNIATTASAANAFINTGSSPAGQLLRSTSSLVYKRDVEPLDLMTAQKFLRDAKPIFYRSRCSNDNPAWSWYGLAAEDVAAIDPRLVHWGYQDDDFIAVEVEAHPAIDGEAATMVIEKHLRTGAVLKPDGVQYERLTALLILGWQDHEARMVAIERGTS